MDEDLERIFHDLLCNSLYVHSYNFDLQRDSLNKSEQIFIIIVP